MTCRTESLVEFYLSQRPSRDLHIMEKRLQSLLSQTPKRTGSFLTLPDIMCLCKEQDKTTSPCTFGLSQINFQWSWSVLVILAPLSRLCFLDALVGKANLWNLSKNLCERENRTPKVWYGMLERALNSLYKSDWFSKMYREKIVWDEKGGCASGRDGSIMLKSNSSDLS